MRRLSFCLYLVLLIVGTGTTVFAEGSSYGDTSLKKSKSISTKGPYYFLKGGVFVPNSDSNDSLNGGGLNNFDIGPNIEGGIGTRGEYLGVEVGLGYYSTSMSATSTNPVDYNISAILSLFQLLAFTLQKYLIIIWGLGLGCISLMRI